MSIWIRLTILTGVVVTSSLRSAEIAPQCFEFEVARGPQRSLPVTDRETWCYLTEGGETLVFPADEAQQRPELVALVTSDAAHRRIVSQASLYRGQITYHKTLVARVEPLPVPTDLTRAVLLGTPVRASLTEASRGMLRALRARLEATPLDVPRFQIHEGTFHSELPPEKQPYGAYWWPFIGLPLAAGPYSPLGKYDAWVEGTTGTNPHSVEWERQYHSTDAVAWGGHCNGWAAETFLYPKNQRHLWDKDRQKVIWASDVDGMLAEASFCAEYAFYGQRYNSSADDIADPSPSLFQEVVMYYIDTLKKPIAFDQFADERVDNNIFSGYSFEIKKVADKKNQYAVVATMRSHNYPHERNEDVAVAPIRERTYQYTLTTDDAGNVLSGEWQDPKEHPDFLWLPIAQKKCAGENPNIDPDQVLKLAQLPEAKEQHLPLTFSLGRKLKASEKVTIPLPKLAGTRFRIHVVANDLASEVMLQGEGYDQYPTNTGDVTTGYAYLDGGAATAELSLNELRSLTLINTDDKETSGQDFRIDGIDYLGDPEAISVP